MSNVRIPSKTSMNKMTKANLINLVEQLAANTNTSDNTVPSGVNLSSNDIARAKLDFAEKSLETKKQLAQIGKEKAEALAKINNEYDLKKVNTLEALIAAEKSISTKTDNLEEFLKSKVAKKELEVTEKLSKLDDTFRDKELEIEQKRVQMENSLSELKESIIKDKSEVLSANKREMEELSYEHNIAIKRKKEDTLNKLSDIFGKELSDKGTIESLEKKIVEAENASKDKIKKEVAIAESRLNRKHSTDVSSMKHSYEMTISKLEAENALKNTQIEDLKMRNKDLSDQVKNIPNHIEKSLQASNSDISITNESKK